MPEILQLMASRRKVTRGILFFRFSKMYRIAWKIVNESQ